MIGLYDTETNQWLGNEDGPTLYDDAEVAKLAAMIVDRDCHQRRGRTRALPFSPSYARLVSAQVEEEI